MSCHQLLNIKINTLQIIVVKMFYTLGFKQSLNKISNLTINLGF